MECWLVDEEDILGSIDEYVLYCYYLGFEPELRVPYHSPIRSKEDLDLHPSFSLYETQKPGLSTYLWKDSGLGITGNIFTLVKHLFGLDSFQAAVHKVRKDFFIDQKGEGLPKVAPPPSIPAEIKIKSKKYSVKEYNYWASYGIYPDRLAKFRVKAIKMYWLYPNQLGPQFVKGLGFAYEVYDKYQLYFPFEEKHRKFRNDLGDYYLFGREQLVRKHNNLLICKSMKDLMLLDYYGDRFKYDVVGVRSENTPIPADLLDYYLHTYKAVFTWFDNDGKVRRDLFPVTGHLEVPLNTGQKDPTDFRKAFGAEETVKLLTDVLCSSLIT